MVETVLVYSAQGRIVVDYNETTKYVIEDFVGKGLEDRTDVDKSMQHHKVFIMSRVVEKVVYHSFPSRIRIKLYELLRSNVVATSQL